MALSHIKEISADLFHVMRLLLGWKTCTYAGKLSREDLGRTSNAGGRPLQICILSRLLDGEACGTGAKEYNHQVGEALAMIFARRTVSLLV